jgi:hypothetical protein
MDCGSNAGALTGVAGCRTAIVGKYRPDPAVIPLVKRAGLSGYASSTGVGISVKLRLFANDPGALRRRFAGHANIIGDIPLRR